jgi:hypothetical protein
MLGVFIAALFLQGVLIIQGKPRYIYQVDSILQVVLVVIRQCCHSLLKNAILARALKKHLYIPILLF